MVYYFVIDGVFWCILLEDLVMFYIVYVVGILVFLLVKISVYKVWIG